MSIKYGLLSKVLFLVIFCSSFFESCIEVFNKWEQIKVTEEIYPKENIDFFIPNEFSNLLGTRFVWVNRNLAYYRFKDYCPERTLITYNLNDDSIVNILKKDSLFFMNKFKRKFKEQCVTHFAFQVIEQNNVTVCFYSDEELNVIGFWKELNMYLSTTMEIEADWKTYYQYLEMK